MAPGSDVRPLKDAGLLEVGLWVKDGATPRQTLLAATKHGAASQSVELADRRNTRQVAQRNPTNPVHH